MNNFLMPDDVFPASTPDGNWKLVFILTDLKTQKEVINCEIYTKLTRVKYTVTYTTN